MVKPDEARGTAENSFARDCHLFESPCACPTSLIVHHSVINSSSWILCHSCCGNLKHPQPSTQHTTACISAAVQAHKCSVHHGWAHHGPVRTTESDVHNGWSKPTANFGSAQITSSTHLHFATQQPNKTLKPRRRAALAIGSTIPIQSVADKDIIYTQQTIDHIIATQPERLTPNPSRVCDIGDYVTFWKTRV